MTQISNVVPNDPDDQDKPTFDTIRLSETVRKAVDDLGYVHPTPVQRAVYEPAARGADLVVQARTGTGKTAAFGLPIVDRLVKAEKKEPQVLVLSPTRELALQISREIEALAKHSDVRCTAVYGGAPMAPQVRALSSGAQVIVGTPGRVLDHLERGTLPPETLRLLVLDESDEMLSMGFLPQITKVMEQLPRGHQTLLFSATLPQDVRRIAETRLTKPEFITLSGDHVGALSIDHYIYRSRGKKAEELLQLIEIENPESAIVFCNTREQTKRIAEALKAEGHSADWLNADLAQNDREKVMAATRESRLRFLVATDVAARGIDISHLTHVINADFPESTENYVHRTGRTGRAGRTGTAISLIAPKDVGNLYMLRLTYKIFPIERDLPSARDLQSRHEADIVRHLADSFARARLSPELVNLARRILTSEQPALIVAGLLDRHLEEQPNLGETAAKERRDQLPPTASAVAPAPARAARGDEPTGTQQVGTAAAGEIDAAPITDEPKKRKLSKDEPKKERKKKRKAKKSEAAPEGEEPFDSSSQRREEPDRPTGELEVISAKEALGVADASPPEDEDELARIFVDVGRRDGAYKEDFLDALGEHGIDPQDVVYIKLRDTHAFVGVPEDMFDRALGALDDTSIAGCTARAERARPRRQ